MRIMPLLSASSAAALAVTVAVAGVEAVHGQEVTMHQAAEFDASRAFLSDAPMFDPFHVSSMQPLREALDDGIVEDETPLLVVTRGGRRLALLTLQMAYHHVAQGSLAGEPWMVSF